jgi:Stress responsive A/B Barrel Domain
MLTHIVIFTWREGVSASEISAFGAALSRMADELKHLVSIRHGANLKLRAGNGDYALVGTFNDQADWEAYQVHPLHKAFVAEVVTPLLASRQTIQFAF